MTPDELAAEIPGLFRFARALVRDEHLAADLTQDTLTRAIERAEQFRNDAPLGAWLKRILRNLAIDRARRSDREVVVDDVESRWHDDEYTVDPADVIDRAATREELEDALARLPFIYRSTVLLHDVEGWTVQSVADLDDIGLPAAKQRLRRGRMALVSALATGAERRHALKGVPMRCWDARQHCPTTSMARSIARSPTRSRPISRHAPRALRSTPRSSASTMRWVRSATATR